MKLNLLKAKEMEYDEELRILSKQRKAIIDQLWAIESEIIEVKEDKLKVQEEIRIHLDTTPQDGVDYETLLDI